MRFLKFLILGLSLLFSLCSFFGDREEDLVKKTEVEVEFQELSEIDLKLL